MIKLFTPLFVFLNRAVVGILVFVLIIPASIIAFYADTEKLTDQAFTATELRFASEPELPVLQYFSPVANNDYTFNLPTAFTASSTKAIYDISSNVSGDLDFCTALRLSAEGYLGSISAGAPYFKTETLTSGASWQMKLGYNPSSTSTNFGHGAKCDVTVAVEGWQENMSKATAGYRDSYAVTIPVVAQMVVLNEVLAKPASGNSEFIELYNLGAEAVDVEGFNITEKTAGGATTNHIIRSVSLGSTDMVAYDGSGNTVIPAHGFLALRYSGGTSYLNDTGDTITLLDTENIKLDTYTFATAVTGKSEARIPDGTGPWIDPIPTPNEANAMTTDEIAEIIPEASVFEVVSEEIIVEAEDDVATGTDPIVNEEQNILEEVGEGEESVADGDETVLADEVQPEEEVVVDDEVVEPETIEEETIEEEEEVKEEEPEEVSEPEEEEVEETNDEPIV